MMRHYAIQDAIIEDCARLAQLHRSARADSMPYLPVLHTPEEDLAFFQSHVFADCRIKVATADTILGFYAVSGEWLEHLYIDPACQHRGIGSALLHAAMEASDKLQLWVFQRNSNARRFYEKHGFILAETTNGDGNEEREPDMRYEWVKLGALIVSVDPPLNLSLMGEVGERSKPGEGVFDIIS